MLPRVSQPLLLESQVVNLKEGYAGTVDCVALFVVLGGGWWKDRRAAAPLLTPPTDCVAFRLDNIPTLIDWKTTGRQRESLAEVSSQAMQVAAYSHALLQDPVLRPPTPVAVHKPSSVCPRFCLHRRVSRCGDTERVSS